MCNRFIEQISTKIVEHAVTCECFKLKNLCKLNANFKFSNKDVRDVIVLGEFDGVYMMDGLSLSKFLEMYGEDLHMAICYLHEQNVSSFFALVQQYSESNQNELIPLKLHTYRNQLKKLIIEHLSCIPSTLFDTYKILIQFDDTQNIWHHKLLTDTKNYGIYSGGYEGYIIISLKLWLYIFLTQESHLTTASKILADLILDKADPRTCSIPDIGFEELIKLNKGDIQVNQDIVLNINFHTKLIENVINKISCKCDKLCKITDFKYSSFEIRRIFRDFSWTGDQEMLYHCVNIPNIESDNSFRNEFYDFAMCYFHEGDYLEFFKIIAQRIHFMRNNDTRLRDLLRNHLNCAPANILRKKIVCINMIDTLYTMPKFLNINAKVDEDTYLVVNFYRWIKDIIDYDNPTGKWFNMWENK